MSASEETSYRDHERDAKSISNLGFAIVTFSDTRTADTDASGKLIRELVEAESHHVVRTAIIPDDPEIIAETLRSFLTDPQTDVVVTNGSTGISTRDTAYEVVSRLIEKRLDGFGELFRSLSYAEIGAAAMLSRAVAGSVGTKILFSMPGSSNAVRLGMTKLILPQVSHIVRELTKQASTEGQ